jgi:hypothetical protein
MKRSDRRFAQRFNLTVPLHIRGWHSAAPEQDAASLNVSESGVYFETKVPPAEGASVHLRIAMPPEITGGQSTEWTCTGKVVRVEPVSIPGAAPRVAVRFSYYEVA